MRPRRRHKRFVRRLEIEFVGEGKSYRAITSDFSRYGLFIRTNHAFVPGTEMEIIIHLPKGTDCKLKGIVRRAMKTPFVSLKNGMGVELTSRDDTFLQFLREFDPDDRCEPLSQPKPDFVIIACIQCGVKNKVSRERLCHGPKCGKCGAQISVQT